MDFGLFIILLCFIFFALPIITVAIVVIVMIFFEWMADKDDPIEQEKRTPRTREPL